MVDHSGTGRNGLRYQPVRPASAAAHAETRLLIEGRVQLGDQRGRTLGFPTANVPVTRSSIQPPQGVFAGYVHVEGGAWYEAAISVGTRATFYTAGELLVEAHLLDFDGDLYGSLVVIELVSHLRDQTKFSGVDELRAQLFRDVRDSRTVLGSRLPRLSSIAAWPHRVRRRSPCAGRTAEMDVTEQSDTCHGPAVVVTRTVDGTEEEGRRTHDGRR